MKAGIREPRACQAPMMCAHHSESPSGMNAPVWYPGLLWICRTNPSHALPVRSHGAIKAHGCLSLCSFWPQCGCPVPAHTHIIKSDFCYALPRQYLLPLHASSNKLTQTEKHAYPDIFQDCVVQGLPRKLSAPVVGFYLPSPRLEAVASSSLLHPLYPFIHTSRKCRCHLPG